MERHRHAEAPLLVLPIRPAEAALFVGLSVARAPDEHRSCRRSLGKRSLSSGESASARRPRLPSLLRERTALVRRFLTELVEQRAIFESRTTAVSRCLEPTPHEAGTLDQRVDLWEPALGDRA